MQWKPNYYLICSGFVVFFFGGELSWNWGGNCPEIGGELSRYWGGIVRGELSGSGGELSGGRIVWHSTHRAIIVLKFCNTRCSANNLRKFFKRRWPEICLLHLKTLVNDVNFLLHVKMLENDAEILQVSKGDFWLRRCENFFCFLNFRWSRGFVCCEIGQAKV